MTSKLCLDLFLITFLFWVSYANTCICRVQIRKICYRNREPRELSDWYTLNEKEERKYSTEDMSRKQLVMHWLENKLISIISIYNLYRKLFLTKSWQNFCFVNRYVMATICSILWSKNLNYFSCTWLAI